MCDSKRRERQWIAEVAKRKTQSTGRTRQKTAVLKPPSQVLYILPLWEKPSDMERVAVDCLIKAKSFRKMSLISALDILMKSCRFSS